MTCTDFITPARNAEPDDGLTEAEQHVLWQIEDIGPYGFLPDLIDLTIQLPAQHPQKLYLMGWIAGRLGFADLLVRRCCLAYPDYAAGFTAWHERRISNPRYPL